LTAAAVIGRNFSFKLLETVLSYLKVDDMLTAVEQAQRMGLTIASGEGPEAPFRFAHEIVRQTLLADISLPRRQRLHLRVADAIETADPGAADERAIEIAQHPVQAGPASDGQRTAQYLIKAGHAALGAAAYETALCYFESALSLVDGNDSRRRAELLYGMAIAERGMGRWEKAYLRWDEALKVFTALDDSEAVGRVCFRIAQGRIWAGRYHEAEEIVVRGLSGGAISADRARLLATLGISKAVQGNYLAAERAFNDGLKLARDLCDSGLKGVILAFRLQFDFFFLRLQQALEESRESAELVLAESGPWPRTLRLCWTQCALYHLGRVEEATRVGDELEPVAVRIGNVAALSYCLRIKAWTEFGKRSDLIQLNDRLQADLEANQSAGLDVFVALSHAQLSVAEFFRGNWEQALKHSQAACRPQERHVMRALSIGTLFRQMAYLADRDGALALLRQHSEKLPRAHEVNNLGSWAMLALVLEGLLVLGEGEQAAALYPLVGELIATGTVCFAFVS
jgi:tetratricopeptide (TPR) repeat protein